MRDRKKMRRQVALCAHKMYAKTVIRIDRQVSYFAKLSITQVTYTKAEEALAVGHKYTVTSDGGHRPFVFYTEGKLKEFLYHLGWQWLETGSCSTITIVNDIIKEVLDES